MGGGSCRETLLWQGYLKAISQLLINIGPELLVTQGIVNLLQEFFYLEEEGLFSF